MKTLEKAIAMTREHISEGFRKVFVKPLNGSKFRSLKVYEDEKGQLYVRTGKRGTCRVYLSSMSGAIIPGDFAAFIE